MRNQQINKKILFGIIAAILIVALLCGVIVIRHVRQDVEEEPSLQEVLEEKLTAYETDLRDSLGALDTNKDVAEYLLSWAKNKEIPATLDEAGNVIYTLKATKGYTKERPAAIVCTFSAETLEDDIEAMTVAMTAARNAKNHGKLSVVFLARTDFADAGADTFDIGHFTDDTEVFVLGHSANSTISLITGGLSRYTITHKLKYHKPAYDAAYKIKLRGCPQLSLSARNEQMPNPIKTLGNLLANFKSTSLLFELASFYGGRDALKSPDKASMTVVVNSSDEEKFTRRMDNAIEKFMDKYSEDFPDITYTYEKIDLPKRVFDGDDTENLVSLMYTAFDGIYYKDDDGNTAALTNIGYVSNKNKQLKIEIAAMSYDASLLGEISEAYETICGLCDVTYKQKTVYDIYDGTEIASALRQSFEAAFTAFTGDEDIVEKSSVEFTPCTRLHEKNEHMPILYCVITEKTKHKFSGALVTWLDRTPEESK